MPQPGSHSFDVQKQRLRKELEDRGVDDDTAEDVADDAAKRQAESGDSKLRPPLPPEASPSANPPGTKKHKSPPVRGAESALEDVIEEEELIQMADIQITDMSDGKFGVEIEEGHQRTAHLVTVPDGLVDDLGLIDIDRGVLVRESMEFLLDREPATSIGDPLSLGEIGQRYPDYYEELQARLAAGT